MSSPRDLLDAYGRDDTWSGDLGREDIAPKAFAALRTVLDLHRPNSKVIDQWTKCWHCHDQDGSGYRPWPCPTVQAITKELEAAE